MADCNVPQYTTPPPFLSTLPLELRSYIYTHLLVSAQPIKGPLARSHNSERYNIHTAILRTCKQINLEARQIFFGKNTFCISSVPPGARCIPARTVIPLESEIEGPQQTELPQKDEFNGESNSVQEGAIEEIIHDHDPPSGAFEPPLQISDLQFIRHLEVDLLYYPKTQPSLPNQQTPPPPQQQQNPTAPTRYITNLSHLLSLTAPSLTSLSLTLDTRPHLTPSSSPSSQQAQSLNLPLYLSGPITADTHARFKRSLQSLSVPEISLRFEFPEARFDFLRVRREVLVGCSLVSIVGQVLLARSEIGIRGVLEEMGEEEGERER